MVKFSIRQHEVQRLANVVLALGWEINDEVFSGKEITLTLHRVIPDVLWKAAGELEPESIID